MTAELSAFALRVLPWVIWLGILAAIFAPLERLFALRKPHRPWREVPADVGFYFLNSLVPIALRAPPLALLSAGLAQVTPQGYTDAVAGLPLWARLAAALAVSE